jgi:hypothetical protein
MGIQVEPQHEDEEQDRKLEELWGMGMRKRRRRLLLEAVVQQPMFQ